MYACRRRIIQTTFWCNVTMLDRSVISVSTNYSLQATLLETTAHSKIGGLSNARDCRKMGGGIWMA
jgi:hypothetical protein